MNFDFTARRLTAHRTFKNHTFAFIASVAVSCANVDVWAQAARRQEAPPELTPLPHPEIPPPVVIDAGLPLYQMILIGLGIALLLWFFLWLLLRKKPLKIKPTIPPLKRALDRLNELKSRLDEVQPTEVGHHVSVILRDYQQDRYQLPAPFRTSEELYQTSPNAIRSKTQARFAPLAAIYDRLAFGAQPSTRFDAELLIDASITALQDDKNQPVPPVPPPLPRVTSMPANFGTKPPTRA